MRKAIGNTIKVIAVTAAVATAGAETAQAESAADASKRERAVALASKITSELYDQKDFPKGVPVPGILRGSVFIDTWRKKDGISRLTDTGIAENPILLVTSTHADEMVAKHNIDPKGKWLDGSWLATRSFDDQGHAVLYPFKLNLGKWTSVNGASVEETLAPAIYHKSVTVENNMAVYPTEVTDAPDALVAFDPSGDNRYQSVNVRYLGSEK